MVAASAETRESRLPSALGVVLLRSRAMASTTDIRKGLRIELEGVPYHVIEHTFVKPGKGQAFTRAKIRNLTNGNVLERTWKSGESVDLADVEDRRMTYSWAEDDTYVFMDSSTGDQIHVEKPKIGEDAKWLAEGMDIDVTLFIKEGEWVKVDTSNGGYLERVNK